MDRVAGDQDPVADLLMRSVPVGDALDTAAVLARVKAGIFGVTTEAPRIGRFEIVGRVGQGGMGTVYAARDLKLDRDVALKVLDQGATSDDQALAEARAMAQLNHPNVVTVYEAERIDDHAIIVMELVRGETLTQWWRRGRTWRDVVKACLEAGRGLAAAHRVGLIHGDFKPDNVLVGEDGRVRVADFGLARPLAPTSQVAIESGQGGTRAYASPERLRGEPASAKSDQFALGLTLRNMTEAPTARAPAWLRTIVLRGTSDDAWARYATVDDMVDALGRGLSRRRRVWAVAAPTMALAVGATATWAWRAPATLPCAVARSSMQRTWSAARADAVQAGFAGQGTPWARQLATQVVADVDRLAATWHETAANVCRGLPAGSRAQEVAASCLDVRRHSLGAVVDHWLSKPDAAMLARASLALEQLPASTDCLDPARVAMTDVEPGGANARKGWRELRQAIADGAVALDLGHPRALSGLQEAAAAQGFTALQAEAADLGVRQAIEAQVADSGERARAALVVATATRDPVLTARANLRLFEVMLDEAVTTEAYGRVAAALPMVEAAVGVAGVPALAVELDLHAGRLASKQGDRERAVAAFRRVLQHPNSSTVQAENAGVELAYTLMVGADFAAAGQAIDRVVTRIKERRGDAHPTLALPLAVKSSIERRLGRPAEAVTLARRAVELADAAAPSFAGSSATAADALASALGDQGEVQAAAQAARVAVDRSRRQDGQPSLALGSRMLSAAGAFGRAGRIEEARELMAEATAELRRAGAQADEWLTVHVVKGELEMSVGAWDAARLAFQAAIPLARDMYGNGHPKVAYVLSSLGEAWLQLKQPTQAHAVCAQALRIDEAALGADHPDCATDLACLGHAEAAIGHRAAAIEAFERAIVLYLAHAVPSEERVEVARSLSRLYGSASTRSQDVARIAARWQAELEKTTLP